MKFRSIATCAVASYAFAAAGCATIVAQGGQKVMVNSAPQGATVTVKNRTGEVVTTGTTPIRLYLKKGAGYFKAQNYTLNFSKPGYAPYEVKLTPTVSGWYFGNILIGGLVGMLAVDPATGAMYRLTPKQVDAVLTELKAAEGAEPGSVLVVSTEDLPPAVLKQATPIVTD